MAPLQKPTLLPVILLPFAAISDPCPVLTLILT